MKLTDIYNNIKEEMSDEEIIALLKKQIDPKSPVKVTKPVVKPNIVTTKDEEFKRMQELEGVVNENSNPNRMLELIQMYVDNYSDEGMSAEAAIRKIDELLQGKLDGYDIAFMAGEEDNY